MAVKTKVIENWSQGKLPAIVFTLDGGGKYAPTLCVQPRIDGGGVKTIMVWSQNSGTPDHVVHTIPADHPDPAGCPSQRANRVPPVESLDRIFLEVTEALKEGNTGKDAEYKPTDVLEAVLALTAEQIGLPAVEALARFKEDVVLV